MSLLSLVVFFAIAGRVALGFECCNQCSQFATQPCICKGSDGNSHLSKLDHCKARCNSCPASHVQFTIWLTCDSGQSQPGYRCDGIRLPYELCCKEKACKADDKPAFRDSKQCNDECEKPCEEAPKTIFCKNKDEGCPCPRGGPLVSVEDFTSGYVCNGKLKTGEPEGTRKPEDEPGPAADEKQPTDGTSGVRASAYSVAVALVVLAVYSAFDVEYAAMRGQPSPTGAFLLGAANSQL